MIPAPWAPTPTPAEWLRIWAAQMLWFAGLVSQLQEQTERVRRGEL